MSKKSNKERKDGRIAVQVYIGKVDGKRKYKTVYGATQKEADAAAELLKKKLQKGIDLSTENNTFKYWAEAWLQYNENKSTAGWHKMCKARADFWIENIGIYNIEKINTVDLEKIVFSLSRKNPRTGKHTAKKTLIEYRNIVNQIFKYAERNRIIDFNPAQFLDIPKSPPKVERKALTDEQIKMVKDTPSPLKTACMIMLYTGLRRGEIIPLTWNDIDLESDIKTVTVNKAVNYSNKKNPIKPPKTKAGYRTVPLPDILVDYLKPLPKNSILVCPYKNNMMNDGEWSYLWKKYIEKLNLKYGDFSKVLKPEDIKNKKGKKSSKAKKPPIVIDKFSAHSLRHTYCTLLYEAGVDVLTAKEYMGHSNIQTTLNIYTHLRDEHGTKAINQINEYLSPKSDNKKSASQGASQNS